MLPAGFLGTRGDVLMDLVIVSFAIIVPVITWSWLKARGGQWALHKRTQLWMAGILGVAVALFEADLRVSGGIFALTRASRFAGQPLLNISIGVHMLLAISTSIIWVALIVLSLRRFASPPTPGAFSATHRLWGRIGMIDMMLTGITGIELYIVGFAM